MRGFNKLPLHCSKVITMSIIEIRCPNCSSNSCHKTGKTNEYECNHCGNTFRFLDTTKTEVVRYTRGHNCPICGRPTKIDEGYLCTECGNENLCENCVDAEGEKFLCKECIRNQGLDCQSCGKFADVFCVCGKRKCSQHAYDFEIYGNYEGETHFSLSCESCQRIICADCFIEQISLFRGKSYYCKKCGSKLKQMYPVTMHASKL